MKMFKQKKSLSDFERLRIPYGSIDSKAIRFVVRLLRIFNIYIP
jgi:hypothetical protein